MGTIDLKSNMDMEKGHRFADSLKEALNVMNQTQNPISHLSPALETNYDTHDPQSYVYIELFLPLYPLAVLLQLIQYLTLVFAWN